jgi:hypothetical protein
MAHHGVEMGFEHHWSSGIRGSVIGQFRVETTTFFAMD